MLGVFDPDRSAIADPTYEVQRVSHPSTERVLVVPGAELDRLGRFQGFSPEAERYLTALLVPELMEYRPRSEVEDDPASSRSSPTSSCRPGDSVFCYTRGKSQGEARLHGVRSLGVGGHVAEADAEGRRELDAYEMAMRRELDEEVDVASPGRMRLVGPDQRRLQPRRLGPPGRRPSLRTRTPARDPARGGPGRARVRPDRRPARPPGRVRDLVADLHRRPASDLARLSDEWRWRVSRSRHARRDGRVPCGPGPAERLRRIAWRRLVQRVTPAGGGRASRSAAGKISRGA